MPSRGWVIFKNWLKGDLGTHLSENYNKSGEFKFPKYVAICECGDFHCNNRRNSITRDRVELSNLNHSINYHDYCEHNREEKDYGVGVYIREDEVLLKKGQIQHLGWDERKELRKMLD